LLYGLLAATNSAGRYQVVGDFLSYDPYGLMFRKDDAGFAALVERAFARLAQSGEIVALYDQWFLARLPGGERLDLPISPQLDQFFRLLGVPE
jgi:glutamate/aspartate transport system substrate-binding protein